MAQPKLLNLEGSAHHELALAYLSRFISYMTELESDILVSDLLAALLSQYESSQFPAWSTLSLISPH